MICFSLSADVLLLTLEELLLDLGFGNCSMGRLLETLELELLLTLLSELELVSLELTLLTVLLELELLTGSKMGRVSIRADADGTAIKKAVTRERGVWMRMIGMVKDGRSEPQSKILSAGTMSASDARSSGTRNQVLFPAYSGSGRLHRRYPS